METNIRMLFLGFVIQVSIYTLLRSDQERLRKMQHKVSGSWSDLKSVYILTWITNPKNSILI